MDIKRIAVWSVVILLSGSLVFAYTCTSPNFSLKNPKIISGGSGYSTTYSLNNVEIGNFLAGEAESSNYAFRTIILIRSNFLLSISLSPTTWSLGSIQVGSSKITTSDERIIILNNGDAKENLSLRVIDVAGTWQAADAIGVNRYVISGIFTDTAVAAVGDDNFNELGGEDVISEGVPQLSTDAKFATTVSAKNGIGILPGEERVLWLKFEAPTVDTTQSNHGIWVVIEAELAE